MTLTTFRAIASHFFLFRCNRCDFAQHFPNPQLSFCYQYRATKNAKQLTSLIPDTFHGWCSKCDGIVLTEDPAILITLARRKGNAIKNRRAKYMAMAKGDWFSVKQIRRFLIDNKEWLSLLKHNKPRESDIRCLRCGEETHCKIYPDDPSDVPERGVFATSMEKHPGCPGNGDLIQLNQFAVRNDSRFAATVKQLEYEFPGVKFDHHGGRGIILDFEGHFLSGEQSVFC